MQSVSLTRPHRCFSLLMLAVAMVLCTFPAYATHFKIWLKAFIPNTGLNIVEPVPGSSSDTMIPPPNMAGIIDSHCYNTNNRGFDSSADNEAKVTIVTEFDVLSPGIANIIKTEPQIGQTIQYNCPDGQITGKAQASNQNITLGDPTYNAGAVAFQVDATAANPFVSLPSSIAPNIQIHGTMSLDTTQQTIQFTGTVSAFPSYEAYMSVDGGAPVTIFKVAPDPNAGPWSLYLTVPIPAGTKVSY